MRAEPEPVVVQRHRCVVLGDDVYALGHWFNGRCGVMASDNAQIDVQEQLRARVIACLEDNDVATAIWLADQLTSLSKCTCIVTV